jgi:hypothetical protein
MTTSEIIKSFRQGGTGNCVSIAVIKAAIQVFGADKVVHFQPSEDDGFAFTMRDGFEAMLTKSEIVEARSSSKFLSLENESIYTCANLCFASMSKRALLEENENASSFTEAIATLNNGEYYYLGADWLGLKHHKRALGLKYIWNNIGVVGASPKHCFFCSEGIVDDYGAPNRINWLERVKYKFFHYYRIAKDPIY